MNRTNIREEQLKLLNILKSFDNFCRENDIVYYLYAGSMLGAVREKGFIKWDGDIDVIMSFEEYKKLDKLAREKGGINGYAWMTYDINKHIPTFFAKVFEPNVDADHLEDYSYIEICPYTGAPKNNLLRTIIWRTSLWNYDVYWVKNRIYKNNMKRKHNRIGMIAKIALFWIPSNLCIKYFKFCCERWKDSDMAFYLTGLYNVKRSIIPVGWLSDKPVYVEFEDIKVPVIKEYDKFLTQLYGNYMIPVQYKRYKDGV